jgi:Family of unknown function (DUF6328)
VPGREHAEEADRTEEEQERLNRQMTELLNELRVAMPGVQVLFAFLLAVPFQQRFADATAFQRDVYLLTLLAAAVATGCSRGCGSAWACGGGRTSERPGGDPRHRRHARRLQLRAAPGAEVDDQRRCTAPAAVYESIDGLRRRLSDTPLG